MFIQYADSAYSDVWLLQEGTLQTVISSGAAFYTLRDGERLSDKELYGDISRIYVIWPEGDLWRVLHRPFKQWEGIGSDLFSDKHKAFEAAYTHFENNPFSALIGGKK